MTQAVLTDDAARVDVSKLEPLFAPRSIAVIGASRTPGSVGNAIMTNLVFGGFTGVIYPVNPKAKSILGNRCVPNVAAIDEPRRPGGARHPRAAHPGHRPGLRRPRHPTFRRDLRRVQGNRRRGRQTRAGPQGAGAGTRPDDRRAELPGHHQHGPDRRDERDLRPRTCRRPARSG